MIGSGPSSQSRCVRDVLRDVGAGAAAGSIAATFVCPLDVIKTRLQVHGAPLASGSSVKGSIIITSLKDIMKREGFRGLYRGLSPTLLALLPNWAVYFAVYEHLKGVLRIDGSEITFYKEGIFREVAFKDVSSGCYYPVASMYTLPDQPNCTVKFNFDPNFDYFPTNFQNRPIPKPMIDAPYHGP